MGYLEDGFAIACGRQAPTFSRAEVTIGAAPMHAFRGVPGTGPNVAIGFTTPTLIYERMRKIDARSTTLDGAVKTNLDRNSPYAKSWDAWLANWRAFYAKYDSEWDVSRLGAALYSDSLATEVERKGAELFSFEQSYAAQPARLGGRPPPLPTAPDPNLGGDITPSRDGNGKSGWTLPWWAWMVGGVALVGAGYYAYISAKRVLAQKRAIETRVLPRLIGQDLADAANARDYALPAGRRDPTDVKYEPLEQLGAAVGAEPVMYRPYEHPHLVPMMTPPSRLPEHESPFVHFAPAAAPAGEKTLRYGEGKHTTSDGDGFGGSGRRGGYRGGYGGFGGGGGYSRGRDFYEDDFDDFGGGGGRGGFDDDIEGSGKFY